MKIDSKKLLGLLVVTNSGRYLGKVAGFELDVDSHQILKYKIRTGEFLAKMFGEQLLISPQQVIKISNKKMIVEDSVQKKGSVLNIKKTKILGDTSSVSMSKREEG